MREAYEGGTGMRAQRGDAENTEEAQRRRLKGWSCWLVLLGCAPLFGAVTGTVTNQTTGKPQAGATVALYKLGTQVGLELIDQAKSDAQGNFSINQTPQGPHLIRTAFDGVPYNH